METSSPPWRVFDSPAAPGPGAPADAAQSQPGGLPGQASTDQRLAIAGVVGAVAIGALAVWVAVSGAGGETIDGPATAAVATASGDPVAAIGELVVDVAGAVVAPGLYHLPAGARVGDAIDAAGGFSPRVDVHRVGSELNLAAALTDGAQVHVPSRDDAIATRVPGGGSVTGTAGASDLLNLNSATKAELEALPGIGPVTADKIIESRESAPFIAVDDLRGRQLVGEKTFEKIRALLTVG